MTTGDLIVGVIIIAAVKLEQPRVEVPIIIGLLLCGILLARVLCLTELGRVFAGVQCRLCSVLLAIIESLVTDVARSLPSKLKKKISS